MRGNAHIAHVPALDGLRGIALLGVLLFHANGALAGGYLGVDLFFVLSGYLITSILLAEWQAREAIDLKSFWIRRARRLFPALLSLMPAVAIVAKLFAKRDLHSIRMDALATLGYVANWRAIFSHKSYWELFSSPSPLEHTWSLSIEEQFYVVWPLVALALLRIGKRRALFVGAIVLALASMLAMSVTYDPASTTRAYYGTDTRAAAILMGAALACVLPPNTPIAKKRSLDAIGAIALGVLAWGWITLDGSDALLYRGGFWITELSSLALVACAISGGIIARALAFRPLVIVGTVSYGAYLWHWPVDLVLTQERAHQRGLALQALRFAVTFAISAVSYFVLERPIRRRGVRAALVTVPASVIASLVVVFAGTYAKPLPPPPPPPPAPVPIRLRITVLGDSTANSLGWVLRGVDPSVAVELAGHDGLNLLYNDDPPWVPSENADATVVVLGGSFLYGIQVRGKFTRACHPQWNAGFEKGLEERLSQLEGARNPVWLATTPYPLGPYDNADFRKQVDCINRSMKKIAALHPKIRMLDLAGEVCPNGACEPGVRPDGLHYDIQASQSIGRAVVGVIAPDLTFAKDAGTD